MRSLLYTNPIGGSVLFCKSPLLITSLEGLDIADLNLQEQKAPFQDGATPIDQLLQPREVVLEGAINAPQDLTGIDTYKRSIISALNPKAGPGTLTYTNNLRSYLLKNVVLKGGGIFKNKDLTNPFQEFQLTFYCHDPYLYDTAATVVALGSSTVATNSGDVLAEIKITIPGPCTNPVIENYTSGYSMEYVGTIASGSSLIISTVKGNLSATIGGSSVMSSMLATSVFWGLLLGDNTITFSCSSGSVTPVLSYYNRYIGA